MTRHTLSHADNLYAGDVFYSKYSPDGRRGYELKHIVSIERGAIVTADPNGLILSLLATGSSTTYTLDGALVSGGVGTFDVPRVVSITGATVDLSGVTFVITGTDEYGETLVENIIGPNATIAKGIKAFKTVTSITATVAIAATTCFAGHADVFGFPVKIVDKGDVFAVAVDGVTQTTLTIVAGLTATTTMTATTADVRGTFAPGTAADGTKRFTALVILGSHDTKVNVFGEAQFGG